MSQAPPSSQGSQPAQPTLINLPQPASNPDTPSETPGTPTSTTTSLSALSTIAIKDGHRGHTYHGPGHRGHQHNLSTNSLEAERADRISRLPGLATVQTLRAPSGSAANQSSASFHTTPPSSAFPPVTAATAPGGFTPAYFDAHGQPVAATKMSTVGTASATESVGGRTTTGDHDMIDGDALDEDMLSMDTNYRETETEMDSVSGYTGPDMAAMDGMDEDRNFEDRMSDDGNASLVGFGEGANSTISGPIYHRRPLPSHLAALGSSAGAMAGVWGLERSTSGLSDGAMLPSSSAAASTTTPGARRDTVRGPVGDGGESTVSATAAAERREARMVDGVTYDGAHIPLIGPGVDDPSDDMFVDTSARGPVPVQPHTSAIRETQQPYSHQQSAQAQYPGLNSSREAAERIVRERLDEGESSVGVTALGSPKGGSERLGRFYFEDHK